MTGTLRASEALTSPPPAACRGALAGAALPTHRFILLHKLTYPESVGVLGVTNSYTNNTIQLIPILGLLLLSV